MAEIYREYEKLGLKDYKLKTVDQVKKLHGIDILEMEGLNSLSEEDRDLVIELFINYLNRWGCGNRQHVPISVEKINDNKFKISFKEGMFSYFYSDGTIG